MQEVDINRDCLFYIRDYHSQNPNATSHHNILVEKYKGINCSLGGLEELQRNISKKMKYNYDRRQQLYNSHFLREEITRVLCDEKKI